MSENPPAVTDPMSRHNLHVTERSDLTDIGPWERAALFDAVKRADSEGDIVVLDYDREQLLFAEKQAVEYLPPRALGLMDSGGLDVTAPRVYNPVGESLHTLDEDSLLVSPMFDILIPAFDWEQPDEQWEPPEFRYRERPSESHSGAIGG